VLTHSPRSRPQWLGPELLWKGRQKRCIHRPPDNTIMIRNTKPPSSKTKKKQSKPNWELKGGNFKKLRGEVKITEREKPAEPGAQRQSHMSRKIKKKTF